MWNAPLLATEHIHKATPSPPARARRFARHRVLRQLGQNELTRTYLATLPNDAGERALVCLELLRSELAAEGDFRALFLDCAEATLSLRHPALAATRDVVTDDGATGLSAEFFDGQPLVRILERVGRSELPLVLHLRILCDVLCGLQHAHAQLGATPARNGLVHGDISPADVFVTYEGRVIVTGVGFSKARHALERKRGVSCGDVGYRAPELFLGYEASAAADVYSVGVMLWEALAQCRRSLALDASSIAKQRTRGEEPDIDEVSTSAPRRLRSICRRALAISRRDRYETALSFKTELECYLAESDAPAAEAASAQLAELLRGSFEKEREEMQLFIGASARERPDPEQPNAARSPGRGAVPAAPIAAPDAPVAARQKASDSGEHRAFSTSLVPAPVASRRAPKRAWLFAAAGLALVIGVTARWIERSVSTRSAAVEQATSSELTSASASRAEAEGPAKLDALPHTAVDLVEPSTLDGAGTPPAAPPTPSQGVQPPAFLEHPGDDAVFAVGSGALQEPPAVRADDLPAMDDERSRLQEVLVDAARRYRARLARREAARRAALRAAAQAAAEAPPAAPIVEENPYDP